MQLSLWTVILLISHGHDVIGSYNVVELPPIATFPKEGVKLKWEGKDGDGKVLEPVHGTFTSKAFVLNKVERTFIHFTPRPGAGVISFNFQNMREQSEKKIPNVKWSRKEVPLVEHPPSETLIVKAWQEFSRSQIHAFDLDHDLTEPVIIYDRLFQKPRAIITASSYTPFLYELYRLWPLSIYDKFCTSHFSESHRSSDYVDKKEIEEWLAQDKLEILCVEYKVPEDDPDDHEVEMWVKAHKQKEIPTFKLRAGEKRKFFVVKDLDRVLAPVFPQEIPFTSKMVPRFDILLDQKRSEMTKATSQSVNISKARRSSSSWYDLLWKRVKSILYQSIV